MKATVLHANIVDPPAEWVNKPALSTATTRLTYGEMRDKVVIFGAWLRESGCGPGDRVALYLPRCAEGVIAAYAVLASGAAFTGIDTEAPPATAAKIIRFADPQRVLTIPRFAEKLRQLPDSADLPPLTELPGACRGDDLDGFVPSRTGPAPVVAPDASATIFFTSGSTDAPKGVEITHRAIAHNAMSIIRTFGITGDDRLTLLPPLHFALIEMPMFSAFIAGASLYVFSDAEAKFPADLTRAMEREQITIWSSVPTATRHLIDRGSLGERDLSALRCFLCGGESFLTDDLRRLMKVLPEAEYVPMYGVSEAGAVAFHRLRVPPSQGADAVPLGVPYDHLDLSLRDADGNEVADGQIGEICLVGPRVMKGYWRDPQRTAAVRLAGRPDSFRTGDFARRGDDGLLYFCGRGDRRVKVRGYNIDLREVETVLVSADGVDEAIALVVAEPGSGDDRIVGIVRGTTDEQDIAAAARECCRRDLATYARPDAIIVREDFPRLPSGKVDLRALDDLADVELARNRRT